MRSLLIYLFLLGCAEDGIDRNHGPIAVVQWGNCGVSADWIKTLANSEGRIIRDDATFMALLDSVNAVKYCKDTVKVDLSEYDLLLLPVIVQGCNMSVDRYFTTDPEKRLAYYRVQTRSYGRCSNSFLHLNAVLIDKLPADLRMIFEVDH